MPGLREWVLAFVLRYLRSQRRRAAPDLAFTVWRKQIANAARRAAKLPKDARVTEVDVNGVPAEWVERGLSRAHRVILYFHGGGYCGGSPDSHRPLVSRLCNTAHARALIPAYRIAPEYPFPAAFEDALVCYRWLLASGIDPDGIAIAGDSAGGGLALATAMAVRDEGLALPGCIVLISPWTDLALSGRSLLRATRLDPFLDIRDLAGFAHQYLDGNSPTDPHASPLYGEFHSLPSTLIHVGSNEVLKDDAVRTAKLAEEAGVDVSVEVWGDQYHVFQALPVKAAEASIARLGSFIRSRTVLSAVARPTVPAAGNEGAPTLENPQTPSGSRPG